jgi:hypothetical protein
MDVRRLRICSPVASSGPIYDRSLDIRAVRGSPRAPKWPPDRVDSAQNADWASRMANGQQSDYPDLVPDERFEGIAQAIMALSTSGSRQRLSQWRR